jgi:hypothetical protein
MKKPIRKFKLTPQAHSHIKEAALDLPVMVRVNPDGTHKKRILSEFKGYDYLDANGNKTEELMTHSSKKAVPLIVNHEINMIEEYYAKGLPGVEAYINDVKEHAKNRQQND